MTDLRDRLRERGWRLTAQRRVVAEVLSGDNVHMTADEIFTAATERLPEISRATVYSTLNELEAMGEVAAVAADGRSRRYDPNANRPHHHLSCRRCGRLWDVHPIGVDQLRIDHCELDGFRPDGVDIVYHGTCGACADLA
ncbi:MAG: Fur family transcriptional regulator [Acidimicrobiales bacterium]